MKQIRIMTYIAFVLVLLIGFNNVYASDIVETTNMELAAHVIMDDGGGGSSNGLLDTIFNKGKRMAKCK